MTTGNKVILFNHDLIRLEEIRKFIDENFTQELTIKSLSIKFTISKSTLQRHFWSCYSEPIAYYIHKCRMARAMALLKERTIPISQIGMTVGYSHRSPFTRAFRKFFGNPPAYFLRRDFEK